MDQTILHLFGIAGAVVAGIAVVSGLGKLEAKIEKRRAARLHSLIDENALFDDLNRSVQAAGEISPRTPKARQKGQHKVPAPY